MKTLNDTVLELIGNEITIEEFVKFLEDKNTTLEQINDTDWSGRNALHNLFAFCSIDDEQSTEKFKALDAVIELKKGDIQFLNSKDANGDTPLHIAISYLKTGLSKNLDFLVIKDFIKNPCVDINIENNNHLTPFFELVSNFNYEWSFSQEQKEFLAKLVQEFYKHPQFNINHQNSFGNTVLHVVAMIGKKHELMINYAFDDFSDFNILNNKNLTAYDEALACNNFDVIKLFRLNKNFDINAEIHENGRGL